MHCNHDRRVRRFDPLSVPAAFAAFAPLAAFAPFAALPPFAALAPFLVPVSPVVSAFRLFQRPPPPTLPPPPSSSSSLPPPPPPPPAPPAPPKTPPARRWVLSLRSSDCFRIPARRSSGAKTGAESFHPLTLLRSSAQEMMRRGVSLPFAAAFTSRTDSRKIPPALPGQKTDGSDRMIERQNDSARKQGGGRGGDDEYKGRVRTFTLQQNTRMDAHTFVGTTSMVLV